MSGIERAWLAAAALHPPFVNQAVLEGSGAPVLEPWTEAVARAAEVNPGARVVLRGMLCWLRWSAEGECPVREVDGTDWDGSGPDGAPFLETPLAAMGGPTSELLLVRGPRPRMILRTAHATMDGGGTLGFLADVFRARNGLEPLGNSDRCTDLDLADAGPGAGAPPSDALAPMGASSGPAQGVVWTRIRVDSPRRPFLGRLLVALAAHARQFDEGPVRFDIPVDLRRANPDVRSTANLTGMVAVEVDPSDTPESVSTAVRSAVASGGHEDRIRGAGFLRHLPLGLVRAGGRHAAEQHVSRTRFRTTAIVSNLGRLDLSGLQAPDFQTENLSFVPPGTEVTPLFVALSGTADVAEMMFSSPVRFCGDGRLDALVQTVRQALQ